MPSLLLFSSLIVIISLTIAERRCGGSSRDTWSNIQSWLLVAGVAATLPPMLPYWRGGALINGARLPFWTGFLIFLVVRDFGEYVFHRAQHRIPFLWAMHSLHHSDPNMSTLTTNRHFWGDQLIKQVSVWSATLMIITPTPTILITYGLASIWHYVSHSSLPINFGRVLAN